MKMYKDGACVDAAKDQRKAMLAAGWSLTNDSEVEVPKTVFVCEKCGTEHETKPEKFCNAEQDNGKKCKSEAFVEKDSE